MSNRSLQLALHAASLQTTSSRYSYLYQLLYRDSAKSAIVQHKALKSSLKNSAMLLSEHSGEVFYIMKLINYDTE